MLDREQINAEARRCEDFYRQGDWAGALDAYLKLLQKLVLAIAAGEFVPNAPYLWVAERIADLATPFGLLGEADELLAKMMASCEETENEYYSDYFVLKRVHLAFMQNDVPKVVELLWRMSPRIGDFTKIQYTEDGLARWERECRWRNADRDGRTVLFTRLCLEIGRFWVSQGQYERALRLFDRGLTHLRGRAHDLAREAQIPLLFNIVNARLEKGDLKIARESLASFEAMLDPSLHPAYSVRRLEALGKLDFLEGKFGDAEERFARAFELNIERGFYRPALKAALNRAHVKIFLNQIFAARRILEDVIADAERMGDRAILARADFLLRLAGARSRVMAGGEPIMPIAQLQQNIAALTPGEQREEVRFDRQEIMPGASALGFFEDQTILFFYHLGRPDPAAVAGCLADCRKWFGGSDSELIRSRLLALAGIANYYEGRDHEINNRIDQAQAKYSQSEAELSDACRRLEAMEMTPELWQTERVLIWCRTRLGGDPSAIAQLRDRAENLLEQMTESLPPWAQGLFVSNHWKFDEEVILAKVKEIETIRAHLARRPGLLSLRQRWAMMKLLHELLLHIDQHKGKLSRKTIEGAEPDEPPARALSLWQRLLRHPPRRVTLSFLVLPDRVLAIRSGFLSLYFNSRTIWRSEVRDLVMYWHLSVNPKGARYLRHVRLTPPTTGEGTSERAIKEIPEIMAHVLSIPDLVEDLPFYIRSVTIVPDDSLHGFPFAAVRYREKYLIEKFALSLGYESRPRHKAPAMPDAPIALLVAVPEGGAFTIGDDEPFSAARLPGAKLELARIETRLRKNPGITVCRLDHSVAKDRVLHQLPSATFFHIACHGYPDPVSPNQSGLLLIPEPGRAEILTLKELAGLALGNLRHVTLSSCWSADNFVLPGRWVISLPETLWRAGAHSILGSLWEVRDDIAIAFMDAFYLNLARYPRDRALQLTQLACLKGKLFRPVRLDFFFGDRGAGKWGLMVHGCDGLLRIITDRSVPIRSHLSNPCTIAAF